MRVNACLYFWSEVLNCLNVCHCCIASLISSTLPLGSLLFVLLGLCPCPVVRLDLYRFVHFFQGGGGLGSYKAFFGFLLFGVLHFRFCFSREAPFNVHYSVVTGEVRQRYALVSSSEHVRECGFDVDTVNACTPVVGEVVRFKCPPPMIWYVLHGVRVYVSSSFHLGEVLRRSSSLPRRCRLEPFLGRNRSFRGFLARRWNEAHSNRRLSTIS